MKISAQDLKTPRQWRAAVGCDAHHFDELLSVLSQAYAALHYGQITDRMVIHPGGTCMKDEADLLFFTLFRCKSGLTYDVLSLVCGMDAATAKRRQDEGLAALGRVTRSPAPSELFAGTRLSIAGGTTALFFETTSGLARRNGIYHATPPGKSGPKSAV